MTDAVEPVAYTYEDAGQLCGVSAETIRARARRGKLWRGRPANSGRPTVLLTTAEVAAISAGRPFRSTDGQPPRRPDEQSPGQAAAAERGEATAAAEERARLLAQLDRLTAELATLRAQPMPPPSHGLLAWRGCYGGQWAA